jgi:hypothetical protein
VWWRLPWPLRGIPDLLMTETNHGLKVDLVGDTIRVYDLNADDLTAKWKNAQLMEDRR